MIQDSSDEEGANETPKSSQEGETRQDHLINISPIYSSFSHDFQQKSECGSDTSSVSDAQSLINEKVLKEKELQDIENKKRLQIYVFVARCIAYPFSAKYRYDMTYKPPKLTLSQLQLAKDRFASFLQGDLKIPSDEAFISAMRIFYEGVLKSEEISNIVNGPGWTMLDFSEVFKKNVQNRLSSLPDLKGISKSTLLNNWMEKFELVFRGESDQRKLPLNPSSMFNTVDIKMSKDQLFDLFQKILHVKKHQHQILYNLLQLDNNDEQAAQVRRELDYRAHEVQELKKHVGKRCLTKEMDEYFAEELRLSIEHLKVSLQSVPVSKEEGDNKEYFSYQTDVNRETLSKHELLLSFHVKAIIKDLKGLNTIDKNKILFCIFDMDGCDKLSTSRCEASNLSWDVEADFVTNCPLPNIKVKLCEENSSFLGFDDKELARVSLTLKMTNTPKQADWYDMQVCKNCPDKNLKIKLLSVIEKPQNVKNFGFLYCQGKSVWKKWKKRYFILLQVSQFTFLMCSYQDNKSEPTDTLQMHEFTLDYCDEAPGLEGGHSYFMLTKEGDEVVFATEDEESLAHWMQALYRATGQSFKPQLPKGTHRRSSLLFKSESEKISRKLFDELAQASPYSFDHQDLFLTLQKLTIEFRIKDPFICTYGWLSSDQVFVLDEYCARYGVRVFMRHLGYLEVLMNHEYDKIFIDPSLLYQKFSFCVAHIHGNKPDRAYTVLKEEKKRFMEVSYKLVKYLEYKITNFRSSFSFGRPDDGLKISLSLLERVIREINYFENSNQSDERETFKMKEILQPMSPEYMYEIIKKCLNRSTYSTYDQISQDCKLEAAIVSNDVEKIKESFMLVAERCIQTWQQINDYHADAFISYTNLIAENSHLLWSMFLLDLHNYIDRHPLNMDLWNFFSLFQLINEYCLSQESLGDVLLHKDVCGMFAPIVIHYLDSMELSIAHSLEEHFDKESWKPSEKGCCSTVKDLLWKLESLRNFVRDLNWPDEIFSDHLKHILRSINQKTSLISASKCLEQLKFFFKSLNKPTNCLLSEELFTTLNTIAKLQDTFSWDQMINNDLVKIKEEMISVFMEKLLLELNDLLLGISRYDTNKLFTPFFNIKRPEIVSKTFTEFIQLGLLQIKRNISDETFFIKIMEVFFCSQVKKMYDWLTERIDIKLHAYQIQILSIMWEKFTSLFNETNMKKEMFQSQEFRTVSIRLEMESLL